MKFEFDKPTSDIDVMKGAEIYLKSGVVDSYDPILTLEVQKHMIEINNGSHTYNIPLEEVSKVVLCNRNTLYDKDIDVIWYKDSDYETIWENEDE